MNALALSNTSQYTTSSQISYIDSAGSASLAFSLVKLFKNYNGKCIRVRRSSDSTELDIGFDSLGNLDTTSIVAFCGAGNGFIKTWYDQSGNGRNLQQNTNSKQFQIVSSGSVITLNGLPSAQASIASATSMQTASLNLTASTSATIYAAFSSANTAGQAGIIIDHGLPFSSGGFGINVNQFSASYIELGIGNATPTTGRIWNRLTTTFTSGQANIFGGIINPANATRDAIGRVRQNAADGDEVQSNSTGTVTTSCFINDVVTVGSNKSNAGYLEGKICSIIIYPSEITQESIGVVETRMAQSCGFASNQFIVTPSSFDLSATAVENDDYYVTSSQSSLTFNTSATSVTINSYNSVYSTDSSLATLGVYVDNSYNSQVLLGASGYRNNSVTLPAGNKILKIVTSPLSRSGGPPQPVLGSWPISIAANAKLSRMSVSNSNSLLIYGDSIAVGGNATNYYTDPWAMKIREIAPYPVALEAWGWRALNDDCSNSTDRAAFVSKIVSRSPTKIWLAIGTNDFGLNRSSAATFQTNYAALLDDLKTALPSAIIYAQSPLIRGNEGSANTFGSTIANFRTAISNACVGKSNVTYIDGLPILQVSDLAEAGAAALHPTTSGHNKYYLSVKSTLGI